MFELKLDFLAFASIRKTLNRAYKANRSRNILKVSLVCYKSCGPTVISYWSKNESCVLYRSYPGQLRSFKRPGYLEVRREKSRFFLATNLGWRSANATSPRFNLIRRKDFGPVKVTEQVQAM